MNRRRKAGNGKAERVGPGNPPKHAQFRKGVSGNPSGRPKGSKNLASFIMEAARGQVVATIGGRQRRISKLQATAMQLASKAAGGDSAATARFLDWVDHIEQRAARTRPAQFPFSAQDLEVLHTIYERISGCDPAQQQDKKDDRSSC